jgi:hypothetical protein
VFAPSKPVPLRIRLFVDHMLRMMRQFTRNDLTKDALGAEAAVPD